MPSEPSNDGTRSRARRVYFTPWKAGICVLAVGLWLATFSLLDAVLPGETEDATKRVVQETIVFDIRSARSEWMMLIMFSTFFGYPMLLLGIFWRPFSGSPEYLRYKEGSAKARGNTHPYFRVLIKSVVGLPLAFAAVLVIAVLVVNPLVSINRVSVAGDSVKLDSLYWSWTASRNNIRDVRVVRREDAGRDGNCASYVSDIILIDGTRFRTNELRAWPIGGRDDRRFRAYFAELRAELTK